MTHKRWRYRGAYSLLLSDDADKSIAPPNAEVYGNTVYVPNGSITQEGSGVLCLADYTPFFWSYHFIEAIHDESGNLLWAGES